MGKLFSQLFDTKQGLDSLKPAIVDCFHDGYNRQKFFHDVFAGIIVGIVALPLSIAFAIASGVKPEQGLITAFVAGFLISAFSGSRVQIGGPTGAFIIILYSIVQKYGYDGLAAASFIAGIFLIVLAVCQLGDVIKFIPYPVTIGFTTGIAVVIFTTQVRDALGLQLTHNPETFVGKWKIYCLSLSQTNIWSLALSATTILIILFWPKITFKIPATLAAIVITSAMAAIFKLPVETIGSRFGEISSHLTMPHLPKLNLAQITDLIRPAISIAMLAGIESLLSAVVADGMTGKRHRSNAELMAQGIANMISPIFGGIPATGAIARTATNIKNGGTTPIAGIVHSVTILLIFLFFAKQAAVIPMATLAGILIIVAYNMSEYHLFFKILRGPRSDVLVLLITFGLTVLVDLTVAIEVGILLAAFLFMRRMILVTETEYTTEQLQLGDLYGLSDDPDAAESKQIPDGVEVFEINGPFFFGAAEKFKSTIHEVETQPQVLILRMRHVPMVDATGIQALEEVIARHHRSDSVILLCEVQQRVRTLLRKAGLIDKVGKDNVLFNLDQALDRASSLIHNQTNKP